MHITGLTLSTQNFQEQQQFYTNILGLPLIEVAAEEFTVRAGTTRLTFRQTTEETLYHFAFTIPANKAATAKEWLVARTPLLAKDEQDQFFFESWNADSVYFRDAAGHILECIAHYDLHNESPGTFGTADLLAISEIGMAVDNVSEQVEQWKTAFGIEPYRDPASEMFAAVGDIHGLFITVKHGRNWFPTSTESVISPVEVTIEGVEGPSRPFAPYPYKVQVR